MDNVQKMTHVFLMEITKYAEENDLTNQEVLSSITHIYAIYGFSVKKEESSFQEMAENLVGGVMFSVEHMSEAMQRNVEDEEA